MAYILSYTSFMVTKETLGFTLVGGKRVFFDGPLDVCALRGGDMVFTINVDNSKNNR